MFLCLWLSVAIFVSIASGNAVYSVDDLEVSSDCNKIAKVGDHLLLEYELIGSEGIIASQRVPEMYTHLILEDEDKPILRALKGMCENSSRVIVWDKAGSGIDTSPVVGRAFEENSSGGEVRMNLFLNRITEPDDYQIFIAMRMNNFSKVIDLVDEGKGVNAVDENGVTILMAAVMRGDNGLPIVATLLNARMPKVDVNMAKANGFTALIYSIEHGPHMMQALLRRGADPNHQLTTEGMEGNTPLHLACYRGKLEHAEMLLEYGASPMQLNDAGLHPLQMVPKDSTRTQKIRFKHMFDEALRLMRDSLGDGSEL